MLKYNHKRRDKHWQKKWEKEKLYEVKDSNSKPKYYALDMFPYPSAQGLHVGHPEGYTATDIVSRFLMMKGFDVLHPMGFDAFGLPAENYAIKTGIQPAISTAKNIKNIKRQIKSLGFAYDWSREINTTDPKYYKWTQWIFLQLFKKGLAYEAVAPINWCPSCKTGLANEEVVAGECDRCGTETMKKDMKQWMLKITAYADRLLKDLDDLDWEERIKEMQRNWIGRSEGAEVDFRIKNYESGIKIFTTRPDTLFGATYMVVAPEHLVIKNLESRIKNLEEVKKYQEETKKKSDLERTDLAKAKTGVELKGIKAINPANGEEIPVWVADYVLATYGTGAIMAVPAHDERDFEFAKKFGLPIKTVIEPVFVQKVEPGKVREGEPFVEREAITAIVKHWEEDKYLGLKWKKVDWDTFITGGVEKGQTPEEAAIAEIREETGYQNPRLVKTLLHAHSKFYHVPKKQNRFAHFHVLYLELTNGDRVEISEEEKNNHEVVWLTKEEVEKFRLPDSHKFSWKNLNEGHVVYTGDGVVANSGKFDGLDSEKAKKEITKFVGGEMKANYHLRDWVFSRQRYWGEPIPIIKCVKCGNVPLEEKDLPLKLPKVKKYEPTGTGESPLAGIKKWVEVKCPKCGEAAKRETNTMPQWAGSSWYWLRFIDPENSRELADKEKLKHWLPVDLYVGGAEHAVLHLLYARFWNKFLCDIGAVPKVKLASGKLSDEPFYKLRNQGMILGEDGEKMSKSRGNVINPDEVVKNSGADALRLYEMFMGPFADTKPWSTRNIKGVERFLERIFAVVFSISKDIKKSKIKNQKSRLIHKTIKKVSEDIENFRFNTAISALMIQFNGVDSRPDWRPKIEETKNGYSCDLEALNNFLILLAPFAPHLAEELWAELGHKVSIFKEKWPEYDPDLIKDKEVEVVVQINGKVREKVRVSPDISEEEIKKLVLASEKIKQWLAGREPKKVIYVKGRLVSIVV